MTRENGLVTINATKVGAQRHVSDPSWPKVRGARS
jgi:hypothetical protein